MPPENWARVKELFAEAVEHDPETRDAFVDTACGGDAELRAQLVALLAAHDSPNEFLDPTGRGAKSGGASSATRSGLQSGAELGGYRILERIGSGGMGVVYRALQISLNRQVALKVLPPGLGMTPTATVRFHREAQAAAKLHHTNIVAVYAEGEADGTCFYAMELVDGVGLDRILAERRGTAPSNVGASDVTITLATRSAPTAGAAATPSANEATRSGTGRSGSAISGTTREHFDTIARWIADAADAFDYAHQQGVIHRDVKPSNLMVNDNGRIKIMDFGLARMLEEPGMTVTGELLGTPRYMSPEQIAVGRMQLDHRTDIYSLGATLYELLTLEPPFPGHHRDEIIAAVMSEEPRRPRQIDRRVPVDLETICLKSIEKDPDRRYATAGAMADDLRRYRNRYAITARHVGPVGRLVKYVRRRKVPTAAAVAIIVLASAAAVVTWKYAERQKAISTLTKQGEAGTKRAALDALRNRALLDDLAALREAINASPDDANLYFLRGQKYLDHDRWQDAIDDFTTALHRDPERGDTYAWRGRAYQHLAEYDAAIDDYRQAIKYEAGVAWIWAEWSGALIALDRPDRVASDLDEMLHFVRQNPNASARAYEHLAEVYSLGPAPVRNPSLASELADAARDLNPTNSSYLTTLAVVCHRRREFAQAVEYLNRRIKERRGGASYYQLFLLAMSYHELGRADEADVVYEQAIQWFREHERNLRGFADRIVFRTLRSEADALLGKTPEAEFPGGPTP